MIVKLFKTMEIGYDEKLLSDNHIDPRLLYIANTFVIESDNFIYVLKLDGETLAPICDVDYIKFYNLMKNKDFEFVTNALYPTAAQKFTLCDKNILFKVYTE